MTERAPALSYSLLGSVLEKFTAWRRTMEKRNSTALKRRMEGRWLSAFLALAPALETAVNKLAKTCLVPLTVVPMASGCFVTPTPPVAA